MTLTAPVPVAPASRMRYGGLVVLMLMSFLLVTAEFLPNGVLTEMAAGLAAAAVSSVAVALAPHFVTILVARFLLGAAISTFWSMSITVAAALSAPDRIGRAVMFTSAGLSLATVAGVPLGVLLSEALDWRLAFLIVGLASALVGVAVRLALPSVPAAAASSIRLLVDTLRRPGASLGLIGHVFIVLGHFLAYTYVRLALERLPEVDAGTVVLLLTLFGAGGLIGNIVIGIVVDRAFGILAVVGPLAIAASIVVVLSLPGFAAVAAAVFAWGFLFASWLIIVNTWVGHRMPDRLEAGGSLVVTGFQLAIVVAAGIGGLLVDGAGVVVTDAVGAALLVIGAVLFGLSLRVPRTR
ncbi:MAG: arabinose efflux permease [Microbacterium sp.]|nr:arabinose efflux permease [Microbacterium sp.]